MAATILICAVILILCVLSNKLLYRFGIPTLLIFLVLGMLFGSDGFGGIEFSDYNLARNICSVGLIFIMFYGGFGTNWYVAKPVVPQSILMSSLGVVITAGLTGLFCWLVLKTTLLEGLLIGSVIGSTDAASVFAILRSRKLNLKGGLASLLEIESGSNDPVAYMLTIAVLTFMQDNGGTPIWLMLIQQIAVGLLIGFVLSKLASFVLHKINFEIQGLYFILVAAIALLAYSASEYLGGNGYLSVYIVGIVIGNSKILHKKSLVAFFDGVSWLMQILLFFTLGLLSFPSRIPSVTLAGVGISLFLIFVARPVATFSILSWFRVPVKQQLFVSWVGLRGAASIVFAIYSMTQGVVLENDIFHIVFFVALFSVAVQGTLIPPIAKKLDLVDNNIPVLKTFTDYQDDSDAKLLELAIDENHRWANKSIMDADIPEEILVVMIKRKDDVIVPKGSVVILPGDVLVLSSNHFDMLLEKKKAG